MKMKRIVIVCLILGCLVPFALLLAQQVLLGADPGRVSQFRSMWYYVWPTAVFLIAAADASPVVMLLILGMAVIANILIYGFLGIIVALCWMFVSRFLA